ncbi:hypothetical protein F5144DRAFT_548923 [Chaetomium tenue]|uniref:Uncharacterized protein n=1 Tax=Chaetomium tenue TaxID=1854479 RepID=A0ACB7P0E9_9PEZI|nr:hypothetical protein F5144DRAFT_548923 [Chaetomium globosum]
MYLDIVPVFEGRPAFTFKRWCALIVLAKVAPIDVLKASRPEEWGGEIAHVHVADGSLHAVLHPEDVRTVIDAGWGERHPLCANDKRWFRLLFHGFMEQRLPVPGGLVLVYAPRDEGELQVLHAILEAAVWYATRGELYPVGFAAEHPKTESQSKAQLRGDAMCERGGISMRNAPQSGRGSCLHVCTCSYAVAETWEDSPNELQEITLPERGGDLALLNPHRVWSTPDPATPWGPNTETSSPLSPFEPPSFPNYTWLGYPPVEKANLAQVEATSAADNVNQGEPDSSRLSPRPYSGRSRGGPTASPQSCIDILEGEATGLSLAAEPTGGLDPESAEGRVPAIAVGHHWLRYEKKVQEQDEVMMGDDDAFTEDDFF